MNCVVESLTISKIDWNKFKKKMFCNQLWIEILVLWMIEWNEILRTKKMRDNFTLNF